MEMYYFDVRRWIPPELLEQEIAHGKGPSLGIKDPQLLALSAQMLAMELDVLPQRWSFMVWTRQVFLH